jgi:hypothetical protein
VTAEASYLGENRSPGAPLRRSSLTGPNASAAAGSTLGEDHAPSPRKVVFDNPDTGRRKEIVSGQGVLRISLRVVPANMERAVRDLQKRDRTTMAKIRCKRRAVGSKPVIAGTRIPVSAIKALPNTPSNKFASTIRHSRKTTFGQH